MEKVKIGIPKSLLYYKYGNMWKRFFDLLNIEYIVSDGSNKEMLSLGSNLIIDESCLSLKIFMGHVNSIKNKCDYILIPRIVCVKKKEKLCTNFMALYDLCNTVFDINILKFNIDIQDGSSELDAFMEIGRSLGIGRIRTIKAYYDAVKHDKEVRENLLFKQDRILMEHKKKVLLVAHPYNLYDELVGKPIIKYLEKEAVIPILSDIYDISKTDSESSNISVSNYWTYNKDLMGAIWHYKDRVDGIIIISCFPCGPDSLSNEIITRKIKDKPAITIIVDELDNDAGMITRLESFIDVIKAKGDDE